MLRWTFVWRLRKAAASGRPFAAHGGGAAALALPAVVFLMLADPAAGQSSDQFWSSTLQPAGKSATTSRGVQTRRSSVSRPTSAATGLSSSDAAGRAERRLAQRANVFLADFGGLARMVRTEPMANGEPYNPSELVAAHASLPLDSSILISDLQTGRSLLVRVKDRSAVATAALELSPAALKALGVAEKEIDKARVRVMSVWVPTGEPVFWPRLASPRVSPVRASAGIVGDGDGSAMGKQDPR